MQERTGVTSAVMAFVLAATKENQLAVYARYLDAGELAFVRANLGKRSAEWPALLARVRTAMDEGRAPDSLEAQALARVPARARARRRAPDQVADRARPIFR